MEVTLKLIANEFELMERRTVLYILGSASVVGISGCIDTIESSVQGISGEGADDTVNPWDIERGIHSRINDIREERDLSELTHSEELREVARSHSEDMAENDYYGHTAPDGSTFQDRYERAGINCRVQISSNQYATGAENIAYTYAASNIEKEDGSTENYQNDEDEIAQGLVTGWMNSPPHRENILKPYWNAEGVGVAIDRAGEKKKVYATQNFC